jgi:hypothetical protein
MLATAVGGFWEQRSKKSQAHAWSSEHVRPTVGKHTAADAQGSTGGGGYPHMQRHQGRYHFENLKAQQLTTNLPQGRCPLTPRLYAPMSPLAFVVSSSPRGSLVHGWRLCCWLAWVQPGCFGWGVGCVVCPRLACLTPTLAATFPLFGVTPFFFPLGWGCVGGAFPPHVAPTLLTAHLVRPCASPLPPHTHILLRCQGFLGVGWEFVTGVRFQSPTPVRLLFFFASGIPASGIPCPN